MRPPMRMPPWYAPSTLLGVSVSLSPQFFAKVAGKGRGRKRLFGSNVSVLGGDTEGTRRLTNQHNYFGPQHEKKVQYSVMSLYRGKL
jgi:hypothetical protein